jgi:hypoxanthine phosphoribosyltransferase
MLHSIKMFISEEALRRRVVEMGRHIRRDIGEKRITMICVCSDAFDFGRDLVIAIGGDIQVLFVKTSDFNPEWMNRNQEVLQGACILAQDIVDSGQTLFTQLQHIKSHTLDKVLSVCLLNKKQNRVVDVEPDYTGFSIPDEYVVGYGMGLRGRFNNLPHIAVYSP